MNEQMKNETHAESYGDGQVVWSVILLYFFGIYKGLPAEDSVTTTSITSAFHYSTGSSGPQAKYSGTTYIRYPTSPFAHR